MGGPGSGNWVRTGAKRGSDLLPRLSVSHLEKAVGLNHSGNVGRFSWTFKGDEVGSRISCDLRWRERAPALRERHSTAVHPIYIDDL